METPKTIDEAAAQGIPFTFGRNASTVDPIESEDEANGIYKWGANNLYPQWLNGLFYSSAIHSGIVRSKIFYTVSGGLNYEGPDQEKWDLMYQNGTSEENLDELAFQMSMDLEIFDGMALRGRWSMDKSRCTKLDLIPFETARQKIESNDLAVSADWSDSDKGFLTYKPLDVTDKGFTFYVMLKSKARQTVLRSEQKVRQGNYPIAPYSGGIKSIQTDIEIVNFEHSEIINNFSLGTILNLNNGKPKERRDRLELEKRIKQSSGTDSAGGTIVLYNNGKDNAATVEKLNGNDLNDRYISLGESNRKNIVTAHSVTSTSLFGLSLDGSFNASEMEIGYNIMQANYFSVRQRQITSLLWEVAMKCNNIKGELTFNEVKLPSLQPTNEIETASKVIEVLSKMNPILANGIAKAFNTDKEEVSKKGQDAKIIEGFKKIGTPKDGVKILYKSSLDLEDVEGSNIALMEEFKKKNFAITNAVLIQVLSLISDGDSFDSIANGLDMKPTDLAKNINTLRNGKYLDDKGLITEKGILEVALNDASRMSIVYSYEVRPELGEPEVIDGTRDFCRDLIGLNRVYTRDEINILNNDMGLDVWRYKGGWYTQPDVFPAKRLPFCRHEWAQNIVFE